MNLQPLETPPLKVSRPVAACSRCRNAKIKCDGKLPACTSCEKNGRAEECTSTSDQFARGKERSYVSTLETRLDKLQMKLEEAQARKPSVVSIPDDETAVPSRRASVEDRAKQEPPTPMFTRRQKRREVTAIDDLVSDFGFLSVNATARDFYGFTTAMSYARLILSACSKEELPQNSKIPLPSRFEATQLIEHYFSNFFVLHPVFDEAAFYAAVDNIYSKRSRPADQLEHWMVRLVLAIACASLSKSHGDQRYKDGVGHVSAALELAESVLHPGNISGVQAIVLLTEYALVDPHHFDSWNLIGAASRAMTDLGLHQDPPKGTAMPKHKLELRRRVFHCIYAIDRLTSLVQTRAFSFGDDSARVKIPFRKPAGGSPDSPQQGRGASPLKPWLSSYEQAFDLIQLRRLQSEWYTDLFQSGRTKWQDPYHYLWDTCDKMRKWFDNLSSSTTPNLRTFFELDLLYSYVYVLSPSPRVPVIAPFAQKLIFEYSLRYAEIMHHITEDPTYTSPLTFYDAMRVYMTGRQFLDVLQQSTDLLLNGIVPPCPEVKPTTAPPPSLLVPQTPQGETVQRFNTRRSIQCIQDVSNCLQRFGTRWGYSSWSRRYQNETSTMLGELNRRLHDIDQMNSLRRPSMWIPDDMNSLRRPSMWTNEDMNNVRRPSMWASPGSMPSSSESIRSVHSYHSSPQSIQQTMSMYQPTPPQTQSSPNHGDGGQPQQLSPPLYPKQTHMYPLPQQQQYGAHPPDQGYGQSGQMFRPPQLQQSFSFNEPTYQSHAPRITPKHQFASWGGYDGAPPKQDILALDEENAVPPRSNP